MDKFPYLLRAARERAGWTMESLAERARLNTATIYRYEVGERQPRAEHVITLANVLGENGNDWLEAAGYPRVLQQRRTRKSAAASELAAVM